MSSLIFIYASKKVTKKMPQKLTSQQFIEKAIKIHGNQFCYDNTIYTDRHSKVEIFCNTCKTTFFQTPHQHIYAKNGCKNCAMKKLQISQTKLDDDFVQQANKIHGFQYEYLTRYLTAHTKIKIKHLLCGYVFTQLPNNHLSYKQGCPKCSVELRSSQLRKTHEVFVNECNKIHNNEYEYLSEYKGDAHKITLRHKKCQYIFDQKATNHLRGRGCPHCASSRAERVMKHCLDEKGIQFSYRHKFTDCINPKTNRQLVFDFYLPLYNTIFELDGPQHLNPFRFYGMTDEQAEREFIECKFRDNIKNQYCKKKEIDLIRINFVWSRKFKDKIDQVLLDVIS